jgi:hypothetical protein
MPVAVEMTFTGVTLDDYDKVISHMGLTPGGAAPPGALFHWVTATDDGVRVVDVWESKERFEEFAQEEIGPGMSAAGVAVQPQTSFHEIHNHFAAA